MKLRSPRLTSSYFAEQGDEIPLRRRYVGMPHAHQRGGEAVEGDEETKAGSYVYISYTGAPMECQNYRDRDRCEDTKAGGGPCKGEFDREEKNVNTPGVLLPRYAPYSSFRKCLYITHKEDENVRDGIAYISHTESWQPPLLSSSSSSTRFRRTPLTSSSLLSFCPPSDRQDQLRYEKPTSVLLRCPSSPSTGCTPTSPGTTSADAVAAGEEKGVSATAPFVTRGSTFCPCVPDLRFSSSGHCTDGCTVDHVGRSDRKNKMREEKHIPLFSSTDEKDCINSSGKGHRHRDYYPHECPEGLEGKGEKEKKSGGDGNSVMCCSPVDEADFSGETASSPNISSLSFSRATEELRVNSEDRFAQIRHGPEENLKEGEAKASTSKRPTRQPHSSTDSLSCDLLSSFSSQRQGWDDDQVIEAEEDNCHWYRRRRRRSPLSGSNSREKIQTAENYQSAKFNDSSSSFPPPSLPCVLPHHHHGHYHHVNHMNEKCFHGRHSSTPSYRRSSCSSSSSPSSPSSLQHFGPFYPVKKIIQEDCKKKDDITDAWKGWLSSRQPNTPEHLLCSAHAVPPCAHKHQPAPEPPPPSPVTRRVTPPHVIRKKGSRNKSSLSFCPSHGLPSSLQYELEGPSASFSSFSTYSTSSSSSSSCFSSFPTLGSRSYSSSTPRQTSAAMTRTTTTARTTIAGDTTNSTGTTTNNTTSSNSTQHINNVIAPRFRTSAKVREGKLAQPNSVRNEEEQSRHHYYQQHHHHNRCRSTRREKEIVKDSSQNQRHENGVTSTEGGRHGYKVSTPTSSPLLMRDSETGYYMAEDRMSSHGNSGTPEEKFFREKEPSVDATYIAASGKGCLKEEKEKEHEECSLMKNGKIDTSTPYGYVTRPLPLSPPMITNPLHTHHITSPSSAARSDHHPHCLAFPCSLGTLGIQVECCPSGDGMLCTTTIQPFYPAAEVDGGITTAASTGGKVGHDTTPMKKGSSAGTKTESQAAKVARRSKSNEKEGGIEEHEKGRRSHEAKRRSKQKRKEKEHGRKYSHHRENLHLNSSSNNIRMKSKRKTVSMGCREKKKEKRREKRADSRCRKEREREKSFLRPQRGLRSSKHEHGQHYSTSSCRSRHSRFSHQTDDPWRGVGNSPHHHHHQKEKKKEGRKRYAEEEEEEDAATPLSSRWTPTHFRSTRRKKKEKLRGKPSSPRDEEINESENHHILPSSFFSSSWGLFPCHKHATHYSAKRTVKCKDCAKGKQNLLMRQWLMDKWASNDDGYDGKGERKMIIENQKRSGGSGKHSHSNDFSTSPVSPVRHPSSERQSTRQKRAFSRVDGTSPVFLPDTPSPTLCADRPQTSHVDPAVSSPLSSRSWKRERNIADHHHNRCCAKDTLPNEKVLPSNGLAVSSTLTSNTRMPKEEEQLKSDAGHNAAEAWPSFQENREKREEVAKELRKMKSLVATFLTRLDGNEKETNKTILENHDDNDNKKAGDSCSNPRGGDAKSSLDSVQKHQKRSSRTSTSLPVQKSYPEEKNNKTNHNSTLSSTSTISCNSSGSNSRFDSYSYSYSYSCSGSEESIKTDKNHKEVTEKPPSTAGVSPAAPSSPYEGDVSPSSIASGALRSPPFASPFKWMKEVSTQRPHPLPQILSAPLPFDASSFSLCRNESSSERVVQDVSAHTNKTAFLSLQTLGDSMLPKGLHAGEKRKQEEKQGKEKSTGKRGCTSSESGMKLSHKGKLLRVPILSAVEIELSKNNTKRAHHGLNALPSVNIMESPAMETPKKDKTFEDATYPNDGKPIKEKGTRRNSEHSSFPGDSSTTPMTNQFMYGSSVASPFSQSYSPRNSVSKTSGAHTQDKTNSNRMSAEAVTSELGARLKTLSTLTHFSPNSYGPRTRISISGVPHDYGRAVQRPLTSVGVGTGGSSARLSRTSIGGRGGGSTGKQGLQQRSVEWSIRTPLGASNRLGAYGRGLKKSFAPTVFYDLPSPFLISAVNSVATKREVIPPEIPPEVIVAFDEYIRGKTKMLHFPEKGNPIERTCEVKFINLYETQGEMLPDVVFGWKNSRSGLKLASGDGVMAKGEYFLLSDLAGVSPRGKHHAFVNRFRLPVEKRKKKHQMKEEQNTKKLLKKIGSSKKEESNGAFVASSSERSFSMGPEQRSIHRPVLRNTECLLQYSSLFKTHELRDDNMFCLTFQAEEEIGSDFDEEAERLDVVLKAPNELLYLSWLVFMDFISTIGREES